MAVRQKFLVTLDMESSEGDEAIANRVVSLTALLKDFLDPESYGGDQVLTRDTDCGDIVIKGVEIVAT